MFRKTTLALAAVTALGAAALAPTKADAHWRGYGWHGSYYQPYSYGYSAYGYGWYGPRYAYGSKPFGWRKYYRYH